MACAIPEAEDIAIRILNTLDEVGLVGPKLALSFGDEKKLTKQVTEKIGVPMESWHVEFIKQPHSPSMQRLEDAMVAASKEQEPSTIVQDEAALCLVIPKQGTLGKSVRVQSGRIVAGEEVEGKILEAQFELL